MKPSTIAILVLAVLFTALATFVYVDYNSRQNERKAAQRSEQLKGMTGRELMRDGGDDAIRESKRRDAEVVDNLWKQYR